MNVRIGDYPQLKLIAWNRDPATVLDGADALALYERNWHFVDTDTLAPDERELIRQLVEVHGNGVLHV